MRESKSNRKLLRMISGCIVDTIHAHGPLTKDLAGSAARRVLCQLLATPDIVQQAIKEHQENK